MRLKAVLLFAEFSVPICGLFVPSKYCSVCLFVWVALQSFKFHYVNCGTWHFSNNQINSTNCGINKHIDWQSELEHVALLIIGRTFLRYSIHTHISPTLQTNGIKSMRKKTHTFELLISNSICRFELCNNNTDKTVNKRNEQIQINTRHNKTQEIHPKKSVSIAHHDDNDCVHSS